MRYAIWTLISALFVVSLIGMTISTLLWSRRVRDAIIDSWVALGERSELPDLHVRTLKLYETLIGVFMLNRHGRVGKRKTLAISCFSVMVLSISISSYVDGGLALSGMQTAILLLFVLPLSILWHWLLEYRFSKAFHRGFEKRIGDGMLRRFAAGFAAGSVSIAAILSAILLLTLPLLLESLARYSTVMDALMADWPKAMPPNQDSSAGLLWALPKLLVIAGMLNGMGMLTLSAASPREFDFMEAALMALSLSSSGSIVVLLGVSIALTHSRMLLRAMAKACEFVASRDPRWVFMASTTLFAIATGLMQAFTFFPMPGR